MNYDIFGRSSREQIREFEFQTHLMPMSDRWGFHIDFPELPRNLSFATDARLRELHCPAARLRRLRGRVTSS